MGTSFIDAGNIYCFGRGLLKWLCKDAYQYCHFYPTALKGCWGIVFTHCVQMVGRVDGRREKVCPGCISETIRCRKLILGRDIR